MKRILIALACVTLCGCPGGGGSTHNPPAFIESGKPTVLKLELDVWGAGWGRISHRYKKVECHYRLKGHETYTDLDMKPAGPWLAQQFETKRLTFECSLPPFDQKQAEAVEYYFDFVFDGVGPQGRPQVSIPIHESGWTPVVSPSATQPVGRVYIDLDKKPGAEREIKIFSNGTWILSGASKGSGLFDMKVADGKLNPQGQFEGLPTDTYSNAKAVWKAGTVIAQYQGKPIPTLSEVQASGVWK